MDPKKKKYRNYALVKEMFETVEVVKNFDPSAVNPYVGEIKKAGHLFLSGEGSSRIFPAKHAITRMRQWGSSFPVATEGGRQAMEYNLKNWAVFCASNSGKTAEMVSLLAWLKKKRNSLRFGLTSKEDTPLEKLCVKTHVLSCGWENAVAATKSVVEQALFHHAMVSKLAGRSTSKSALTQAAEAIESALTLNIQAGIVKKAAAAKRIYFAGRNDGVAEELTLKTNEITRLPSAYLEGTYAVHGIEEVMNSNELVVVVDPFEEELDKFKQVLSKGVGMSLVAISDHKLSVPTIVIPTCKDFNAYVQLAAGWNLLVDIGLANGVDLDTPVRARKVGNEASAS